jgi:hypothetical protein
MRTSKEEKERERERERKRRKEERKNQLAEKNQFLDGTKAKRAFARIDFHQPCEGSERASERASERKEEQDDGRWSNLKFDVANKRAFAHGSSRFPLRE